MKKFFVLFALALVSVALVACDTTEEVSHEDGRYRGAYIDRDGQEVVVQFDLEDNVVTAFSFRALQYGGANYLDSDDPIISGIGEQHKQAAEHLIGQDIREALTDLYEPGDLDIDDVDGFSGATIRSNKIVSAVRDALNRGVYSYPG